MWDYTDKVKEYFMHPKNVGVIENADAVAEVGSITCGDALKLMLKVEDGTEKILDAKFQTFRVWQCYSIIFGANRDDNRKNGKRS